MKISYDRFRVKIFGIVALVSFILAFAVSIISNSSLGIAEGAFVLLPFVSNVFVITLILYVLGKIYLIRLKNYGYEVPYKAKKYDNDLNKLPKDDKIYNKLANPEEARNKWSIRLSLVYFVGFVAGLVYDVIFYNQWKFLKSDTSFLMTQLIIFDFVWLGAALYFLVQSDNDRYRDAFNLDENKKKRMCFAYGIIIALFVAMISVGTKMQCVSAIKYMVKSYASTDLDTLNSIRAAFFEQYKNYPESFKEDQYIITDMDMIDEPFWTNAAETLGVKDFKELKSEFHVSDGDAKVAIRVADDGNIVVELLNPHKSVKKEMILGN